MATTKVDIGLIDTSGTASSSTFLRGDGAWQAAGGDWTFVSSTTASTSSEIAFTNMATAFDYLYVLMDISTSSDTTFVESELGVSGPTYRTSNYLTTNTQVNNSGSSGATEYTDAITINRNAPIGTASNESIRLWSLWLCDPANSGVETVYYGTGGYTENNGTNAIGQTSGKYTTAEAQVAIRFFPSSGTIDDGIIQQFRRQRS